VDSTAIALFFVKPAFSLNAVKHTHVLKKVLIESGYNGGRNDEKLRANGANSYTGACNAGNITELFAANRNNVIDCSVSATHRHAHCLNSLT
jgi:hypothetical protein